MIKFSSRLYRGGGTIEVSQGPVPEVETWAFHGNHNFSMSYGMEQQDDTTFGIGIEIVFRPKKDGFSILAPMIIINRRGYYLSLVYMDGR
jgi:hypothetical protein